MGPRVDVVAPVHPGERPQVGGGPVGDEPAPDDDRVVLHAPLHDLDQRLAGVSGDVRHDPVEPRPLRDEGPVGVHRRARTGSRLEGRHREVGRRLGHLRPRPVPRHRGEPHHVPGARAGRAGDLDRGHRVLLDHHREPPLDPFGAGRDRELAGGQRVQEAARIHGGETAPVARPLELHQPPRAAVVRERAGGQAHHRPREEAHPGIVDLDGCDRWPGHPHRRREGADERRSRAARGRGLERHAELGLPLGHAPDEPTLQHRGPRVDVGEDADPRHRIAVGVVGDDPDVFAQGEGVADLHDHLGGFRTHFRDERPDPHRRRIAPCGDGRVGNHLIGRVGWFGGLLRGRIRPLGGRRGLGCGRRRGGRRGRDCGRGGPAPAGDDDEKNGGQGGSDHCCS